MGRNADVIKRLLLENFNFSGLHQLQNSQKRYDHLYTAALLLQKPPETELFMYSRILFQDHDFFFQRHFFFFNTAAPGPHRV